MRKPLLAMFVVAAVAIGLLILLAVGLMNVEEDGREQGGWRSEVSENLML
jgi:hypothetical protein